MRKDLGKLKDVIFGFLRFQRKTWYSFENTVIVMNNSKQTNEHEFHESNVEGAYNNKSCQFSEK
jgi:hypothetical protein